MPLPTHWDSLDLIVANFNELTMREIQFCVPPWALNKHEPVRCCRVLIKVVGEKVQKQDSFFLNQHSKDSSFSFSKTTCGNAAAVSY